MKAPSLQDFSVIHQFTVKATREHGLSADSSGFYYVLLSALFDLQDDEIENSITDNSFWASKGESPTRDRGIDCIYIDERGEPPVVHFLNCKYTALFKKTRSFFPANEVDKMLSFINDLMSREDHLLEQITPALRARITEIWNLIENTNPRFIVHFASNYSEGLTPVETKRLEDSLKIYSGFAYEVETQERLATLLAGRGRKRISTKLRAIHKNLFQQGGGEIRALIAHVEGEQLLRALSDDEAVRSNVNCERAKVLAQGICEDAFNDNVRVYLQQRSKVNRNIKATAVSDENARFFYYNNGITMTCDRFTYPGGQSGPIIELDNVQVVNGGQTIHALFDAYHEAPEKLETIELLCRIYETTNAELSSRIAEHTNTQTPVKTRDIRSIDIVQIKLEQEFYALDLFYERKKNQYAKQPKNKRVDAEKCGQVALAFYHDLPLEAKNKKQLIFGDKYDAIFSDETTAQQLLLPVKLFDQIEAEKAKIKGGRDSWLRYASYHILYALKLWAQKRKVELDFVNVQEIWRNYAAAKKSVSRARVAAKKNLGERFEDVLFFKSGDAKVFIRQQFS